MDTCIWLNLFKKEVSYKGVQYWKIAEEFIHYVKNDKGRLYISPIILKELKFKSGKLFEKIKSFFFNENYIELVKFFPEDYEFARRIEDEDKYGLSFYDYLNIAIAKRLGAVLVTRDREMINLAKRYILVKRPEDLIL